MKQAYFLIAISPLINLFRLTFVFLHPKPTSCIDPHYLACAYPRNKTCGDGQTISFPFYIQDKQDSFCGFPGFNVSCNDKGQPILKLENSDYIIQHINYNNHSIRVSNAAVLDTSSTSCLPPIQNISLPEYRFTLAANQTDLFLLYNCNSTRDVPLSYMVNCSKDSVSESALAVFADDHLLDSVSSKCGNVVEVPVDMDGMKGSVQGVKGLLERGFLLNWAASNCSRCETSGGKCGFDHSKYYSKCFCPDRPRTLHCVPADHKFGPMLAVVGAVAAGVAVALISLCYFRRHISYHNNVIVCCNKKTNDDKSIESFLRNHVSLMQKRFSYSEIKKMTCSFRDKLGQGGYGSVFKGRLPDGHLVAVKVLNESRTNGEEFINEVASISRTSHVNIVTLMGFCVEGSRRALIYEFMSNGSLEKYIHQGPSQVGCLLEWETLHQIAVGIAQGLEYLHKGCNTRILHFDIKPHNILLDENFCPKISDFGLAKMCLQRESIISMLSARGTAGYIAPEVFCRSIGGVSHKSDVYSYGMMVLEMVRGRRNISVEVENTSEYFPEWIYKNLESGEELGLPQIRNEHENQLARRMIIVSLWCIQIKPSDRPPMSRVIEMLQGSIHPLLIPPRPYLSSALSSPPRFETNSSTTFGCDSSE